MARKCVLCNSDNDLRENIEGFINNGGNYVDAAQLAQDKGLDISHTSIQRHIENHTEIEYCSLISQSEPDEPLIKIAQPIKIESWGQVETLMNDQLREIMGNLTLVCNSKLKSYMRGETKFPKDEFATMRSTYSMLNKKGDVFEVRDEVETD